MGYVTERRRVPIAPKFNCARIAGCITLTMNVEMAKDLLSILQDFNANELYPHELAMLRQLEGVTEDRERQDRSNDHRERQDRSNDRQY